MVFTEQPSPDKPDDTRAQPCAPARPQRKAIAPGQLLINGRWVDAQAGETMVVADPTTEAEIIQLAYRHGMGPRIGSVLIREPAA